jgi:hypothetical protein
LVGSLDGCMVDWFVSFFRSLVGWLHGWLTWSVFSLTGWLAGSFVCSFASWLIGCWTIWLTRTAKRVLLYQVQ